MATKKQGESINIPSLKGNERAVEQKRTSVSPVSSVDASPEEEEEGGEQGSSEDDSTVNGSMSLDVLAQVASDRLEREPKPGQSPPNKVSKKNLRCMDLLTLEQIRMLTDRNLVNMFAEMVGDEIKKNYTYTCCLLPDTCRASFSSFGNESQARGRVRSHLLEHIGKLLQQSAAPGCEDLIFTAETVNSRKKRLSAVRASQKKYKKRNTIIMNKSKGPVQHPVTRFSVSTKPKLHSDAMPAFKKHKTSPDGYQDSTQEADIQVPTGWNQVSALTMMEGIPAEEDFPNSDIDVEAASSKSDDDQVVTRSPESKVDSEKSALELLLNSQPYHDHSYTTVFGKKQGIEKVIYELDSPEQFTLTHSSRTMGIKVSAEIEDETPLDMKNVLVKVSAGASSGYNNIHIPIVRLAKAGATIKVEPPSPQWKPNQSPIEVPPDDPGEQYTSTPHRPYPPMPKSELARHGRMEVPEEESSSDEEQPPVSIPRKRKSRISSEGTAEEYERKTALKCIRDLRCKKKETVTELACKICKNKSFTAAATLMYHYRSHAGIKPFVCLICNTTFTRQHSLNYHMLIHNNQSRFTCKDCGRKFRHPSHFKEHLRRHTGETPFHCTDCPQRFKTRNTYKRHLKTRHGKLLTANGIKVMAPGELLKMRDDARYRRHKGSQFDNDDDDDDDEDDDEEEDEEIDVGEENTTSRSTVSGRTSTRLTAGARKQMSTPASDTMRKFCSQLTQVIKKEAG